MIRDTTLRLGRNIYSTMPDAVDARTIFDSLSQAEEQILPDRRFKGQRFTVKGNEGEKPVEYWFIEDFVPGSDGQYVACPKCNSEVPPADETEGCDVCMTGEVDWDEFPGWVILQDIVPQPVLYQPGGDATLPPLSGETIMASLNPEFSYKSFDKVVTDIVFVKRRSKSYSAIVNGIGQQIA